DGRPGAVRRPRRTRPRRGPRAQRTPTRLPSAIPCRPRRRTVRCELAPAEQPRPLEPRPRRPSGQAYRIQGRPSLLATFTPHACSVGPALSSPKGGEGLGLGIRCIRPTPIPAQPSPGYTIRRLVALPSTPRITTLRSRFAPEEDKTHKGVSAPISS